MKFARWALLLFQVFFTSIYAPAHTRGAITVSGGRATAACCETGPRKHAPAGTPTSEDRQCCAVCHLVSHYTPVEPLVLELEVRAAIRVGHERAVAQARSCGAPTPLWPTAPPAARA